MMIALIYSQCGACLEPSCAAAHGTQQDPFVQFGTTQKFVNEKKALVQNHLSLAEKSISAIAKPNQTGTTPEAGLNRLYQDIQEKIHTRHKSLDKDDPCSCVAGSIYAQDAIELNFKLTGDFLRYASQELMAFATPAAQGPLSTLGARQIIKELITLREQLQKILDENFSLNAS